jgi:hypothetical protein
MPGEAGNSRHYLTRPSEQCEDKTTSSPARDLHCRSAIVFYGMDVFTNTELTAVHSQPRSSFDGDSSRSEKAVINRSLDFGSKINRRWEAPSRWVGHRVRCLVRICRWAVHQGVAAIVYHVCRCEGAVEDKTDRQSGVLRLGTMYFQSGNS